MPNKYKKTRSTDPDPDPDPDLQKTQRDPDHHHYQRRPLAAAPKLPIASPSPAPAMNRSALAPEEVRVLDQARQRVLQLTNSIQNLQQDVLRNDPLPPWESFQASAAIIAQNVQTLTAHLARHSELLSRTAVYPSPNYPGRTEEDILGHLLRKKLEPQVQTWVEEGRDIADSEVSATDQDGDLWQFAAAWVGDRVAKYALEEAGDDYTIAERELGVENVNTGLRRMLDEDGTSDDEEGDDEMEDVGMNVTSARRSSTGQVEFDMSQMKKQHDGTSRNRKEIARLATSGSASDGLR